MKTIRKNSDTVIIRNECLEKYLRDIKKTKILTQDEEYELLKRAKAGDIKARHELVTAHLKFVVTVAKEYQVRGFDIGDLINAGNIGLIEAIDKFQLNNEVKVKFLSYAVWWIKNCIIEHIKEHKNSIRLPFNKQADLEKYSQNREKLEQKYQMVLNAEQVFEMSDQVLTDDLRSALMCSTQTNSLDCPLEEGETSDTLGETIAGTYVEPMEAEAMSHRRAVLDNILSELTDTQQKVLRLSFGMDDLIPRSNEDIAETLKLTAERVRQIKDIAIKKIRIKHKNKLANLL
jgi:RNA polymerase primary sigma factor